MKRLIVILSVILALQSCKNNSSDEPVAFSPDGRIKVSVQTIDGVLTYSVSQDGDSLIVPSVLGFELMGGNILGNNTEILSVKHTSFTDTW